jgi:hypothetical protein
MVIFLAWARMSPNKEEPTAYQLGYAIWEGVGSMHSFIRFNVGLALICGLAAAISIVAVAAGTMH